MRECRYLSQAGITLGVDLKDGFARVALAAQSPEDAFNSRTGRDIINILFDCEDTTLKVLGLKRNVVRFPYGPEEKKPQKDIIRPLIDYLADNLGERIFYRKLQRIFALEAVTDGNARQVARDYDDISIYRDWEYVNQVVADQETMAFLNGVETEEELHSVFFAWEGSVDCILQNLRRFASEVYEGTLELGQADEGSKRVAPRRAVEQKTVSVADKVQALEETEVPEQPRAVAAKPRKPEKS